MHPAACGLWVRRAPPPPPQLCNPGGCTSSAQLQPSSTPSLTCKQKGKGEGPGEPGAPCTRRTHRLPPSTDPLRVSLGASGRTPGSLPPIATISTPSGRHLREGSEFTSFVWMLLVRPPPTPSFATLTSTPAGAEAEG